MIAAVSQYLERVRTSLRLDYSSERAVITELETHIEEQLDDFKAAGQSEEEAIKNCLGLLGSAVLIGRQLYEAHSQGSWRQTLLASMPHLLFALLFACNWWQGAGWLLIMLALVIGTALYGWFRGKPAWLFPWLGYSLLPVVVSGLFLFYLPEGWAWLTILLYIALALRLLFSLTIHVQITKRDWLYNSLMWLPLPVIIGWLVVLWPEDRLPRYNWHSLDRFAPLMALSFLTLALAVAIFVRLRQRWLKIAVLVVSGLSTLTMVAFFAQGRLTVVGFCLLTILLLGLFLAPAFVERGIKERQQQCRLDYRLTEETFSGAGGRPY